MNEGAVRRHFGNIYDKCGYACACVGVGVCEYNHCMLLIAVATVADFIAAKTITTIRFGCIFNLLSCNALYLTVVVVFAEEKSYKEMQLSCRKT